MSAVERAAQFSTFAAFGGLDKQMYETARLVGGKIELCYFVPDECKNGSTNRMFVPLPQNGGKDAAQPRATGVYVTKIGTVKQIADVFCKLLFADGAEGNVSDKLWFDITE